MKRQTLIGIVVGLAGLAALWLWHARPAPSGRVTDHAIDAGTPPPAPRAPAGPPLRLSAGEVTRADSLAQRGELSGHVLSARSNRPVPNAQLVLSNGGAAFEARTKADGSFSIETDAGDYQVTSLTAEGFVPFAPEEGQSPIVFVARPGVRLSGVTLFLTPARTGESPRPLLPGATRAALDAGTVSVRGRVVADANGEPIAGALVIVDVNEARTTSDGEGRFTFDAVPAATATIRAAHVDWVTGELRDLDLRSAQAELVLRLKRGGAVRGHVRDGGGKPVVAFTVMAQARRGAMERGVDRTASVFDAEGRFTLTGLESGKQCLSVAAHGYAPANEQCLDVTLGNTSTVDFTLSRGSKLEGRVFDRTTRAPIAHATVGMETFFDNGGPLPIVAQTETNDDGRFTLTGLQGGVRSIFVSAKDHHSRVLPGVQLDPERPTPPIEIDLLATEPGEEPRIESAGLNIAVRAQGDQLVIQAISPGGGGAQAGLLVGDVVLRVDGVELAALGGMTSAIEKMRGPEGSVCVLTIKRGDQTFDVAVTRRRIVNR